MYDVLRARYRFHCPSRGDGDMVRVPLSAFRRIDRLPGAAHPAVYRVEYTCVCRDVHQGLVSHSDLDYGPLNEVDIEYVNLMTGRTEPVGEELADVARSQVQRGNWPWRLYCSNESRLKPVFPSSLVAVLPHTHGDLLGVAMSCPSCGYTSLNLVSEPHLDVPFFHDRVVHYVQRPFGDVRDMTLDQFRERLQSSQFDAARSDLPDAA